MAAAFSARIESEDFPCEDIEVSSVDGREGISRLSEFDIELVVPETSELDPEELIGCSATLVLQDATSEGRRFHGVIVELQDRLDGGETHRLYRIKMMPRASRLSLVRTQEVFLNLSVPDILRQKLALVGLSGSDVEMRLTGEYPLREFVVQFDETDLAFVSRLCEHLGISWFFEHTDSDKLVFTDDPTGFRALATRPAAPFSTGGSKDAIHALQSVTRATPAAYVVQDYNYRSPRLELTGRTRSEVGLGGGVVEYGSHHKSPEEGTKLAKVRAEELEAHRSVYTGASSLADLAAGYAITIQNHPRLGDSTFLLTEVEHHAKLTVGLGQKSGGEVSSATYKNTFAAISRSVPYRPARVTPKPKIPGILTAVVQPDGKSFGVGDHAKLDEDGRYTVKFFFDTANDDDKAFTSRRIRMLQPHSGPGYGVHFPLKPGVEVAIVFMGGDPDRPVIAGALPNAMSPAPVTSKNSLVNRIKTASGITLTMKDGFSKG